MTGFAHAADHDTTGQCRDDVQGADQGLAERLARSDRAGKRGQALGFDAQHLGCDQQIVRGQADPRIPRGVALHPHR